jgi:hypothetical protein
MRNTTDNVDGVNKVMLATAAIALLIPPVVMFVMGPQQKPAASASSQLTITPKMEVTAPAVPEGPLQGDTAPLTPALAPYAPGAHSQSVEVASAEIAQQDNSSLPH